MAPLYQRLVEPPPSNAMAVSTVCPSTAPEHPAERLGLAAVDISLHQYSNGTVLLAVADLLPDELRAVQCFYYGEGLTQSRELCLTERWVEGTAYQPARRAIVEIRRGMDHTNADRVQNGTGGLA